jgi:hypothetical protein
MSTVLRTAISRCCRHCGAVLVRQDKERGETVHAFVRREYCGGRCKSATRRARMRVANGNPPEPGWARAADCPSCGVEMVAGWCRKCGGVRLGGWIASGLCRDQDPDLWQPGGGKAGAAALAAAVAVCEVCPVRRPCRRYAEGLGTAEGVWGGVLLKRGREVETTTPQVAA